MLRNYVPKALILVVAIAALGGATYAFVRSSAFRPVCETFGGKWSSRYSSCVTRSCASTGSCGKWVEPGQWCDRLQIGDPVEEVIFQLGDPDAVLGSHYSWQASKASDEKIVAIIEERKLKVLICGGKNGMPYARP